MSSIHSPAGLRSVYSATLQVEDEALLSGDEIVRLHGVTLQKTVLRNF